MRDERRHGRAAADGNLLEVDAHDNHQLLGVLLHQWLQPRCCPAPEKTPPNTAPPPPPPPQCNKVDSFQ